MAVNFTAYGFGFKTCQRVMYCFASVHSPLICKGMKAGTTTGVPRCVPSSIPNTAGDDGVMRLFAAEVMVASIAWTSIVVSPGTSVGVDSRKCGVTIGALVLALIGTGGAGGLRIKNHKAIKNIPISKVHTAMHRVRAAG